MVKIGISNNPEGRAKAMQTSTGNELSIEKTIKFKNRTEALEAEAFLHRDFSSWRRKPSKINKSSEWFDAAILPRLLEYDTAETIKAAMKFTKQKLAEAMEKVKIL